MNRDRKQVGLVYPSNLAELVPSYLQLAIKTTKDAYNKNNWHDPDKLIFTGTIGSIISLPIPSGLLDSTAVNWADAQTADLLQAVANKVLDRTATVSKAMGHHGEQHVVLEYGGVGAKIYTLFYEFIPQNAREANTVEDIVKALRRAQLPMKGGSVSVVETQKLPDMVKMIVKGPASKNMKFLPCFITRVSVDRSYEGTFIEFSDGNVPSLKMTVELIEISNYTKEIFDRVYG